jgi:peroxisomal coenzyme A diphosphatase NUDT7
VEIDYIKNRIQNKTIGVNGEPEMERFSVIIPLIRDSEGIKVVFEVRAKTLRNQPGEISFPGGRLEKDESSREAGIRETCEELGILPQDLTVYGGEDILVTQYNRIIYPFVGEIKDREKINPSEFEVDHIFYVPLDFFIKNPPSSRVVKVLTVPPEDFPYEDIASGENYKWIEGKNNIYFYKYMNYTIWGLTARIMYNFVRTISDGR